MKRLKLFPKIFLYTLVLMLSITLLASGMIYFLAPIISSELNEVLIPGIEVTEDSFGEVTVAVTRSTAITRAVLGSLPYSMSVCLLVSLVCAFFFSRAITRPIQQILDTTTQMAALDRNATCAVRSSDEIGMLSKGINDLYQKLLSTIEHLEREKNRVSEAEKQKVEFLRIASHELKTPVTALNAMLENMIMGVGRYKDYATYLPLCKEQTEQLGGMISEILETSKLGANIENESAQAVNASSYLFELCAPYQLIAQANGQVFRMELPGDFTFCLPPKMFAKALSNILANAVANTTTGKSISVSTSGRELRIDNECEPIPAEHLKHIFEPFYRPDYARNREDGGNGLGLYIVASILDRLNLPYSFSPLAQPEGMRFSIKL